MTERIFGDRQTGNVVLIAGPKAGGQRLDFEGQWIAQILADNRHINGRCLPVAGDECVHEQGQPLHLGTDISGLLLCGRCLFHHPFETDRAGSLLRDVVGLRQRHQIRPDDAVELQNGMA